ncbi:ABC transporter permease [Tamaricihabitans halophyticus]|uniref:ABC transporter permease n=1 Tax=Tamaricihabitans halophyticus TaxID=1262583 RepID=UPI0010514E1B|nr:ABC transporter permease [Tamaricihabitans halophyticus]
MTTFIQFAVLGLGLGAVYVGLATGLLLVHRATGIINFAQGAMGMWGAYVFAQLQVDGTLVFPVGQLYLPEPPGVVLSLFIALLMGLLLGILAHYLVFRPVRHAPVLAQVVVSIGLMVAIQALVVIRFGPNNIAVDEVVPRVDIALVGVAVSGRELVMAVLMVGLAALVWVYLQFTRAGSATRAAAENERGAALMGFSPDRLAGFAIMLSTVISTAAVILGSSITGLNPENYTLIVVPALAVLLLARLESIALVCVGGLALGVLQSELNLVSTSEWWPTWAKSGLDQVVPFLIVMVILFAFGKRLPSRGSLQTVRLPDVTLPRIRLLPAVLLIGGAALAVSLTSGQIRFGITSSMIMMLLALSYVVITGYLGQISLAQLAFAGAAGFTLSKIATAWGLPFPLAVLLSSVVAILLGMLVALPAFRIRGAQLAITTMAAALAIERFVFGNYSLTPPEGNPIAEPMIGGVNFAVREGRDLARLEFSVLVLVVAALAVLLFIRLASGDTGRAFLAVRSNERAAASAGINVRMTKLIGFGLSAFIAGLAGCLIGYSHGQLSAESFEVFVGLQILAVAYVGGITSFGGALVAGLIAPLGILYVVLHQLFEMGNYYALITGIGLMITAILHPSGIAGEVHRAIAALRRKQRGGPAGAGTADAAAEPGDDPSRKDPSHAS